MSNACTLCLRRNRGCRVATTERSSEAEQAFKRRMAKRVCGSCGGPAEVMKEWGGQRIAICGECEDRLHQPGFRCLLGGHPCEECIIPPLVEARIVDAELVIPATDLVPTATRLVSRNSPLSRALAALASLFRR